MRSVALTRIRCSIPRPGCAGARNRRSSVRACWPPGAFNHTEFSLITSMSRWVGLSAAEGVHRNAAEQQPVSSPQARAQAACIWEQDRIRPALTAGNRIRSSSKACRTRRARHPQIRWAAGSTNNAVALQLIKAVPSGLEPRCKVLLDVVPRIVRTEPKFFRQVLWRSTNSAFGRRAAPQPADAMR